MSEAPLYSCNKGVVGCERTFVKLPPVLFDGTDVFESQPTWSDSQQGYLAHKKRYPPRTLP